MQANYGDINLHSLLTKAFDAGYCYAAMLTDYCFDRKEIYPYIVSIPALIMKLHNNQERFLDIGFTNFDFKFDSILGVGVHKDNSEPIMFFYGGASNPKLAKPFDYDQFMIRWKAVTNYYLVRGEGWKARSVSKINQEYYYNELD